MPSDNGHPAGPAAQCSSWVPCPVLPLGRQRPHEAGAAAAASRERRPGGLTGREGHQQVAVK